MKKLYLLILFILSLISVVALFHPGLPITHDGQDHVARIANFYQNLQEGIIVPRWAGNLNWGYGHPILEFLYPLPSYFGSIFHFLGFSFVDSTKIVFGMGMILSGIFMFLWLSEFLDKNSSFVGALLYIFTPYRFVDLYVRGAIGENFIFIWFPLILYFMLKTYKTNKLYFAYLGAITLSFLILSHNAISLMFLPFIIFYGFFLIFTSKKRKKLFLHFLYLIIIGFSLSAFFWIPAFIEGKYTLRNIVTANDYLSRFVDIKSLIYGVWSYGTTGQFSVQIGIMNLIFLVLSFFGIFSLRKRKDKIFWLVLGLLVYFLISVFLMLSQSTFLWDKILILKNFQFPWRFLSITVFATSTLSAIFLSTIKTKYKTIITVIIVLLILILSKDYWVAKGYQYKTEAFYSGIYNSTTDTGESSPIWGTRFMGQRPKSPLEIIDGIAAIKEKERTSILHKYSVNASKKTYLLENTVYFPGWTILDNKKPALIEFQDIRFRGLMTFKVEKGLHEIEVFYKDTRVRQMANLISFLSIVVILGLFGIELRRTVK